jgi:hypothetical protein
METTTAIVPAETTAVVPRGTRAVLFAEALKEEAQQRQLLGQYVKEQMTAGTDFGVIPGTDKPTLLKPGAEKLVDIYRCYAEYICVAKTEDFDKPLFAYEFKSRIIHRESGSVVAEGVGSCNSREGKYRWRNGDRKCPKCSKAGTLKKSKFPPRGAPQGTEPGWYCYAKVGGCGAEFAANDKTIVGQEVGKVENDDVCTYANTVLKMAKKRALVDAAIALARCSDIFTQDVEDLHENTTAANDEQPAQQAQPQSQGSTQNAPPANDKISEEERDLAALFDAAKTDTERKAVLEKMKPALARLGQGAALRLSSKNQEAINRLRKVA